MKLEERVRKGLSTVTTTAALKTRQALYGLRHTIPAYQDLYHTTRTTISRKTEKLQTAIIDSVGHAYTSLTGNTETPQVAKQYWQEARNKAQAHRQTSLEGLRSNKDTKPFSDFLLSGFASLPPYYASGVPAAFALGALADAAGTNSRVHDDVVAWGTFGAQIAVGYGTFAYSYARQQRAEFSADGTQSGRIKPARVVKFAAKTLVALSPVEAMYGLGKTPLHKLYIQAGMGDETGSVLADLTMMPVWYAALFLPAAVMFGLTENKHSPKASD